jgi:VanZ family protein
VRVLTIISSVVAFASGMFLMLALVMVLSLGSKIAWSVPALVLATYFLLGLLPALRQPVWRIRLCIIYGAAFGAVWLRASNRPALGELVQGAITRTTLLLALVLLATVLATLLALWRARALRDKLSWQLVLLLLFGLLVAFFSGPSGRSDPMIDFMMRTFGMALEQAEAAVFWVRKTIHFLFYGLFALTAWGTARRHGASLQPAVWFALLFPLAHALFDELRQSVSIERTAKLSDVVLDLAGIATFTLLAWYLASRKERRVGALGSDPSSS